MNLKKEDRNLYERIHNWARKNVVKPSVCNRCKEKRPLELSNNSRMYMISIEDWEWICHKCHGAKDRWSLGRKLTFSHKQKIGKANSLALKGNIPWNKGKLIASTECICEKCGKHFFIVNYKVKRGRGRFCSLDCRKKFYVK